MNKFFKFTALVLIITALFSLTACKEVENGCVIKRIKITLSMENNEGDPTECEVFAKLYVNYAPKTVEHVEALVNGGYYNGVDIADIKTDYCVFGNYTLNKDDKLSDKDQGSSVEGEFYNNGWKGNNMGAGDGAILLLHDEGEFNSGKATLAVSLSASAPFDRESYCVFGRLLTNDGDKDADEKSLEHKNSLERFKTVLSKVSGKDGEKYYYCKKDEQKDESDEEKKDWTGKYFVYHKESDDEDAKFKYYIKSSEGEETEIALDEDEEKDLKEKMEKNPKDFVCIPALKVTVKKIEFIKK